jgi:GT2 family glycosyltransferase
MSPDSVSHLPAESARAVHIAVIIVSWNTRELLRRCLQSVMAEATALAPMATLAVWVVDNASTDGSPAMVRELFPTARLVENEGNVGFGRANNQALAQAGGDFVLLLNPDTETRPGALASLLRFMLANPAAGVVGARLLNSDGSLQTSCYPAPSLSRELWFLLHLDRLLAYGQYDMSRWPLDRPQQVDTLKGACWLMRRQALDQVGYFDERFFMYSEEVELCSRLRRAGWTLHWLPEAVVVHHEGQSTAQAPTEMFLRLYQGKLLYFRKVHGRATARLYKLVLLTAAAARLLLAPLAWLERPARRRRHLALAGQYRRLVAALPNL